MAVSADETQRSEERRDTSLQGYLRRGGQPVEKALFENVSENGCRVVGDHVIGEIMVATIPTVGTVEARVRWSIGGRAGLQFLSRPGNPAD
ncbi:PilZ domain-containing protein [Sphingomonas rosea]